MAPHEQGGKHHPALRVLTLLVALAAIPEAFFWFLGHSAPNAAGMAFTRRLLMPLLRRYWPIREWLLAHPVRAASYALFAVAVFLYVFRELLLLWFNEILPRITGTHFKAEDQSFPFRDVDLLAFVRPGVRERGQTIVGLRPPRRSGWFAQSFGRWVGLAGLEWEPVFLSERQRSTHRHILGKTGSGKTASILFPMTLCDLLDGKGLLFIDGKGSDENLQTILGIAALASDPEHEVPAMRKREVLAFCLPAWNQPLLFSHTYNLVYVRPKRQKPDGSYDEGGDPNVTAERVFSILPLGENTYYNKQAELIFKNLCRLLHGIVEGPEGQKVGVPFTMRDISVCLKGVGALLDEEATRKAEATKRRKDAEADAKGTSKPGAAVRLEALIFGDDEDDKLRRRDEGWGRALKWCLDASRDERARKEIESQVLRLAHKVHETFSGVVGAVDCYDSPIVNAYEPDIIIEDVLEHGAIVYVQLPGNMFKIQSPALGRVLLMDLQQEGALRQVFRSQRSQRAFSVVVDEFGRFAERPFVDSLNQLRDANVQFTIAHQSLADLQLVSPEFANAVWDNCRARDVLNQDNPTLCEMLAKSIGTTQVLERTTRSQRGPLFTAIKTQDSSNKMVEGYILHPNRIKNLARCGQGYLHSDEGLVPVNYPMFPERLRITHGLATPRPQHTTVGLRLYEKFVSKTLDMHGYPLSPSGSEASGGESKDPADEPGGAAA